MWKSSDSELLWKEVGVYSKMTYYRVTNSPISIYFRVRDWYQILFTKARFWGIRCRFSYSKQEALRPLRGWFFSSFQGYHWFLWEEWGPVTKLSQKWRKSSCLCESWNFRQHEPSFQRYVRHFKLHLSLFVFHLSYHGVRETTLAETDAHHLFVKVYHELRLRLCAIWASWDERNP